MKKYKLSYLDTKAIILNLRIKYTTIGSLDVSNVGVYQFETVNEGVITTVKFEYGFISKSTISFIYSNDELVSVSGTDVTMKFIEEMKDLLKEIEK